MATVLLLPSLSWF